MRKWGCTLYGISANWNGGTAILRDLTLHLPMEDVGLLPIMGPSGAGKSTLLYLAGALKWPARGKVQWTFPDQQHHEWGPSGLWARESVRLRRKYFGFAFQDSTLLPYLRVVENLTYPLVLLGANKKDASRRAQEALEKILLPGEKEKISDFLQRFPFQLSGGQRQRIALTQALIHDPYVLFADEPAGNLDFDTRQQVMKVLKDWVVQGGGKKFLVWVTHHTDDPELMEVERVLYVDNATGYFRDRTSLQARRPASE